MPTEIEGTHAVGDTTLYTKTWKPDSHVKAKLIFIHGFNDHINRYYDLFPTLASRGIEVHGFDQRGWGRSVKKTSDRGLTGPTTLVISDLVSFIKSQLPSPVPLFVMGHSMGGGEALTLASERQYEDLMPSIRGWILESPYIALAEGYAPSSATVFLGRLIGKLLPNSQRFAAIVPENLTRDPDVVKSLKDDSLLHGYGTLEGLSGMLDRSAALHQGRATLNKGIRSIWLGHGTEDRGTSYNASDKWLKRQTQIEDKELKTYKGWYHQLHADLPGETAIFSKDVGDWILARAGAEDLRQMADSKL